MVAGRFRYVLRCRRLGLVLILTVLAALLTTPWASRSRRTWSPQEVPVAFWAWRNDSAKQSDVVNAIQQTDTRTLFLRAGQIDYSDGKISRIREVKGSLPTGISLHLVYNGTRALLAQLENIDETALRAVITNAYQADLERASRDQANVAGIQLDIDVPTRLLDRYTKLVHSLRLSLPPGTVVSITGLPTWMNSDDLRPVLQETDFWIPQCYGTEIPRSLDKVVPISSVRAVRGAVSRARELGEPFYVGVAAYSYVLLYGPGGQLVTVRGDMDPARIAGDQNLEFVDAKPFDPPTERDGRVTSEWRYVYRVRADAVVDDLVLHAGDTVVLNLPTPESLRATTRAVRELAGDNLLGICIFRLPSEDDPATLSLSRVKTALSDSEERIAIDVTATLSQGDAVILKLSNDGNLEPLLNESIKVDVSVPQASLHSIDLENFSSAETLCGQITSPQPCSDRRANIVRLHSTSLPSTQAAQAQLLFKWSPPKQLNVNVEMQMEDGRRFTTRKVVSVATGE